jgi:hypothetical protein
MSESKSNVSRKRRLLSHLGKVAMGIVSASFVLASYLFLALAVDIAGSEGGKKVLNEVLKIARSNYNVPAL